jgi:hypothetical protein
VVDGHVFQRGCKTCSLPDISPPGGGKLFSISRPAIAADNTGERYVSCLSYRGGVIKSVFAAAAAATVLAVDAAGVVAAGTGVPPVPSAYGYDCNRAVPLTGCGWLTAPSRFVYCRLAYLRHASRLDCYSTISGYSVGVFDPDQTLSSPPSRVTVGRDTSYRGLRQSAYVVRGEWANDRAMDADVFCRASRRFFACDGLGVRVWFKSDGTFAVLKWDGKAWQLWARG